MIINEMITGVGINHAIMIRNIVTETKIICFEHLLTAKNVMKMIDTASMVLEIGTK